MNLLIFWKNEQGEDELITAPLDGTILPGVTRDSLLTLFREMKRFKVSEKPFKIQELIKASDEGRLYEIFGCGTAALISPVCQFKYKDRTINVPIDEEKGAGPLAQEMLETIQNLQSAKTKRDEW